MSAAIWSEPGEQHDPHGGLGVPVAMRLEDLTVLPEPAPGAMRMRVYGVMDDGLRYDLPLREPSGWREGLCLVEGCDCGGV